MPPKQRTAASKSHGKQAKTSSGSNGHPENPADKAPPSSGSRQPEDSARRRRRSKVKWSPVFKKMGYVALIFLVPSILNYAALKQESRMLVPKGIDV